jgi:hypothetical protein
MTASPEPLSPKDAFSLYEEGKHRRYNLLFAVNGGAFAIAKVFAESETCQTVLGGLTLKHLAIGMMIFSLAMVIDIYCFGNNMRNHHLNTVFGMPGKGVLLVLGLLICVGWGLVGR